MIETDAKLTWPRSRKVKKRVKHRYTRYFMLGLFLFAFWLVISPNFSVLNLTLGALSSILVVAITESLFANRKTEPVSFGVFVRFPFFVLFVIWEIIKANIDVARIVADPKLPIDPRVFEYRSHLKGDWEKTLFTYFINLTPGTVVLDIQDDVYHIHGLARHHQTGLDEGKQEKMIAWLFGYKLEKNAGKST